MCINLLKTKLFDVEEPSCVRAEPSCVRAEPSCVRAEPSCVRAEPSCQDGAKLFQPGFRLYHRVAKPTCSGAAMLLKLNQVIEHCEYRLGCKRYKIYKILPMFCLLMSELVNIVRNSCKEIQLGLRAQAMVDNFRDFDLEGRTRFLKWLSRLSCLVTSFQLILVLERSLLTTEPNFAALCTKRITSVSKCYTVAAQYIILLKTARWSDFVVFLTLHLQNMHILITKRKIRLFLQF